MSSVNSKNQRNLSFEYEFEDLRKKKKEIINELKQEKEKILYENISLKNNIDTLNLDIDFLINFQKYIDPDVRILNENSFRHKKSHLGSPPNKDENKEFFKLRRSLMVRYNIK